MTATTPLQRTEQLMNKTNKAKARNTIGAKRQRQALRGAVAKSRPKASSARGAAKLGGAAARGASKLSSMIAMLRRPNGTTIEQMAKVTGWQAHSVRGAISGALKKKRGLTVTSDAESGGVRVYRIVG
jgi:hypothetical protein